MHFVGVVDEEKQQQGFEEAGLTHPGKGSQHSETTTVEVSPEKSVQNWLLPGCLVSLVLHIPLHPEMNCNYNVSDNRHNVKMGIML